MQQLVDNLASHGQTLKILLEWPHVLLRVLPMLLVNPPVVLLILDPNDKPNCPQSHFPLNKMYKGKHALLGLESGPGR